MTSPKALPKEINDAVDRVAAKRARQSSGEAFHLERFAVLNEVETSIRKAQLEVVDELRASGMPLGQIGAYVNLSPTATSSRYGRVPKEEGEARESDLPGQRISQVTDATESLYAANIYKAIRENPGAAWYTVIPTDGKRGSVTRILDVDGMKQAIRLGAKRPGRPAAEKKE